MSQFFTNVTAGNLPPTVVETITGNTGGPESAVANNFNFLTAHSTVKFVGSAATETLDFALSNLLIGSAGTSIGIGSLGNVGLGSTALLGLTTGQANTAIGFASAQDLTSATSNSLLGYLSGSAITTSSQNTAVGETALQTLSTGSGKNTAIGVQSLFSLRTGDNNTCVGYNSGFSYSTSESNNIILGENTGTAGESFTIRIGIQGTQTACFLAGVSGVTVSGAPVNVSSTGQLGSLGFGSSGQVLTSNGLGVSPTWKATSTLVTITSPAAYPYTTLTTDNVIIVDSSVARTIIPMGAPATGQSYRIKDNVGSAAANNITITPSGANIDGAASYVINNNYGSVDIVYNGTQWNKF